MKLLHTADLHLGKVFHDQSLIEDQAQMLEDLTRLLENGAYTALLVSGDVYDRSIPSPEAVELFGSFLGNLKQRCPDLHILVIPGNHDSASRLGYGRDIFSRFGINMAVSIESCDKPVVIEKENESCAFFLLPFMPAGALLEEMACRMEKARESFMESESGSSSNTRSRYSVLAAHLFTSGGEESGSERIFVGSAEQVNISLFKGFDYIALGHLHRCQEISSAAAKASGFSAWYAGSPLAYSFAEAGQEKVFLSVELCAPTAAGSGNSVPKIEKIPIKPKHRVTSLSGPFSGFVGDISSNPEFLAAANDYLEIRLTDRSITENARDILRKCFPKLLSLRQDEALAQLSSAARSRPLTGAGKHEAERRCITEDFRDFLTNLYGDENSSVWAAGEIKDEITLFEKLLAEVEEGEISS